MIKTIISSSGNDYAVVKLESESECSRIYQVRKIGVLNNGIAGYVAKVHGVSGPLCAKPNDAARRALQIYNNRENSRGDSHEDSFDRLMSYFFQVYDDSVCQVYDASMNLMDKRRR